MKAAILFPTSAWTGMDRQHRHLNKQGLHFARVRYLDERSRTASTIWRPVLRNSRIQSWARDGFCRRHPAKGRRKDCRWGRCKRRCYSIGESALQPYNLDADPEYYETQQPRTDHRKHHVAVLRVSESARRLGPTILGERKQPASRVVDAIHIRTRFQRMKLPPRVRWRADHASLRDKPLDAAWPPRLPT